MRIDAWRDQRLMALAIATLAIAVYANSLANGFAYDDVWIIERNPRVHQLADQAAIWLTPYWPTFGPELGLYRPLTIFLYALQWAAGDGSPLLFHAANVAMHAGVSVLVFLLLIRLGSASAAFAGGALFAVHPVHTEVVANVVGQAELLAAAGTLASCILFAGRPEGPRVPAARLVAIVALYAAAMLAKESAIVLPGLLVAADVAQGRFRPSPASLRRYAAAMALPATALGAAALAFLTLRLEVLGTIAAENAAPSLPYLRGDHRLLNAFRAWPEYARLLFLPADLSADYSPAVILPVTSITPMVAFGAALLASVVLLALALPVYPHALPAAWFLVSILPVSNLLVPIGVLVAERTLYLPSVAASMVAASLWDALRRRATPRRIRLGTAAAAAIGIACAIRVIERNPDWKSTHSVLLSLLRDHPESYRGHWYAVRQLIITGDTLAADDHWLLGYRLFPNDYVFLTEYGTYQVQRGRYERAVELLREALALNPRNSMTLGQLATAYAELGRFEEALPVADSLLHLIGPTPPALELRARILAGLGRHESAVASLRSAVRHSAGGSWAQWLLLGRSLSALERVSEASTAFDTAAARAGRDTLALKRIEDARRALAGSTPRPAP